VTHVFGEVASIYDDVRPGYPDEVRAAVHAYAGRPLTLIVELGAGTGKGTELLVKLDATVIAIEPDPRMAAVLQAKFPTVKVVNATFEEWTPPIDGVDLIASATAWHWMDPATRNRRAFDALALGGVLAVFQHRYDLADHAQSRAVDEFLTGIDPDVPVKDDHWALDDVTAAGLWSDVEERQLVSHPVFSKQRYLALMQTFSPFRRHSAEVQRRTLDGLGALLDDFGGEVVLELLTSLVLCRKGGERPRPLHKDGR
jgi:SAM-dependent methyltransferase